MHSVVPNEYQFLEVLNGIWSVLDIALLAWFSYYIWDQVRRLEGFSWKTTFKFWHKQGLPGHINAAIAIYVFGIGDLIVRVHIWYWRHYLNLGFTEETLTLWPLVIGSIIATAGLLCKIRVFTIYRLGNAPWIMSLFLALALVLTALLTHMKF